MKKYKPIIKQWQAFKKFCRDEKITTIRKNGLKARSSFEDRLKDRFDEIKQTKWNQDIFRLGKEVSPGKSVLHWKGEYYVQEESACIPVEVLNPQEGDKILDMCAAPGGKTTQIADQINNKGKILANDKSSQRLKSLHSNIYRTGSLSVKVTNYDGRRIPEEERFDKILLDAPCSGEGSRCRRNFQAADPQESKDLSTLQKDLLEKASKLLKQGGELVYSTCTINPMENEEVVSHSLKENKLKLKDFDLRVPFNKGVTEFGEEEFNKNVTKTKRVYPHHLNSGVIYIAKFSK